jgi:GntR family transcriptional regulator/MocR family aminotransferase
MLRTRIDEGRLSPGERLPSSRALAADLGVSRSTVVAVYEQLAAEGYIETSAGARARVARGSAARPHPASPASPRAAREPRLSAYGSRVAALALPRPPVTDRAAGQVDFLYGALSPGDFPAALWRRACTEALMRPRAHLYYGPPDGEAELRTEVAGYLLRARGVRCAPEQVLIVQGSQQAIDLCARVLIDPGDPVVVEEPGYAMARRAFEAAGARVLALPVDEHGLVTRHLPEDGAALAYVTPSHQFPLGGVMAIGRRRELLSWAARRPAWIVEDDYDGEFRYGMRPVDTLQSLDEAGTVIYVGTFSKALSPQLRLGYLVLPRALVGPFRQAKQLIDRHAPGVEQIALASLIRDGAYERHVRRLRRANERRRGALIEALAARLPGIARIDGAASGLHLVLWLDGVPMQDEADLVAQARARQVGVWPVGPLYACGVRFRARRCAGLVLGYASLDVDEIERGVARLADAVSAILRRRARRPAAAARPRPGAALGTGRARPSSPGRS